VGFQLSEILAHSYNLLPSP